MFSGNQLSNWYTSHRTQTGERHHRITMTSQHICLDISDRDVQFLRNKGAETRCIQHTSHANYALTREMADMKRKLRHRIERVRHHDNDRVGRIFYDLLG